MRKWCRVVVCLGMSGALVASLSGCAAKAPVAPPVVPETTPMPTVPPATPTPLAETPPPLPTRPVAKKVETKPGVPIGPVVTFLGAARADGTKAEPASIDKDGTPTYMTGGGGGFIIVVEAKPGLSGAEVARRIFVHVPGDPSARPDLEIQVNRDLGDGSPEVCDRRRPNIGGIPGINPPSFAETQKVADTLNDFACRFETFIESDSSCTMLPTGDYAFLNPETTTQFCMLVAHAYRFPEGDTIVSVRVRDVDDNPGPVARMRIRRMQPPPKAPAKN